MIHSKTIRVVLALSELLWFVFLAWPGAILDRYPYFGLRLLMDETAWAFVFLSLCAFNVALLGGYIFPRRVASTVTLLDASLWTYISATLLLSVYPPSALAANVMINALLAAWGFVFDGGHE